MSFNSLRVSLGLEDVDVDINIGDTPEVTAAEFEAGTVSSPDAEVSEAAIEASAAEAEVEQSEAEVTALEHYHLALSQSMRRGGVSRATAQFINIGVEHIVARHGIHVNQFMPSLESYEDNAEHATAVSMEKVSLALEGAKDSVKNALKKFWEMVQKVYHTIIVKLIPFQKKKIESLVELANKASGKVDNNGETKFKISPNASMFYDTFSGFSKFDSYSKEVSQTFDALYIMRQYYEAKNPDGASLEKAFSKGFFGSGKHNDDGTMIIDVGQPGKELKLSLGLGENDHLSATVQNKAESKNYNETEISYMKKDDLVKYGKQIIAFNNNVNDMLKRLSKGTFPQITTVTDAQKEAKKVRGAFKACHTVGKAVAVNTSDINKAFIEIAIKSLKVQNVKPEPEKKDDKK